MNLLEHYIIEIHSVKKCEEDWVEEDWEILEVDLTHDCYGRIKRETYYWKKGMFEQIKKQGYFMG